MAYSEKEIKEKFSYIISEIKKGRSLTSILNDEGTPCDNTFDKWCREDDDKMTEYTRAREIRADLYFEQIYEIANHTEEDHTPFTGGNVVQRDRLRIDALKWMVGKMNPKKYGDKIDVTSGNEPIKSTIINLGNGLSPNEVTN